MTHAQWMRRKRAAWWREVVEGRRSRIWACWRGLIYDVQHDPEAPADLRASAYADAQW